MRVADDRAARLLLAPLVACLLTACVTLPGRVASELQEAQAEESNPFRPADTPALASEAAPAAVERERTFDASTLTLESGQIVVSETGDALSLFFSLFTEDFAPWVHAGILAIEDGVAYVYDANGTMLPIPGLPPTATVAGGVRRVPLERFVRGKRVIGFYAPAPGIDRAKLVAFAREHHARGTPFDSYFDADDKSALYCTEFVALGIETAGAVPIIGSPMRDNVSLAKTRGWLRVHAHRLILAGQLLDSAREVAIWSPRWSRAQVEAYFAAKKEVHRRFELDARIGHVFGWNGLTLQMRPAVRAFFEASLAAAAIADTTETSLADVRRTVARTAATWFRPTPHAAQLPLAAY
jgi:hypothetical protein